jgi:hypothetical protein
MLGALGRNMNFFVFPGVRANGRPIADAKQEGSFKVVLGEQEFRWRLPLSSLLPPKICPKCHETDKGAWKFCPWCGTALPAAAAPASTPTKTAPAKASATGKKTN